MTSILLLVFIFAFAGCQPYPNITSGGTQTDTGQSTQNTTSDDATINETINVESDNENDSSKAPDDAVYAPSHIATINVKDYGPITVELYSDVAPETVRNFVSLAESGFYNGLTFHRIIDGFMIQGGDPNGNGTGGSSENVTGEFSSNGFENNLSHVRGTISMARSSDPNSGSSQFFIVQTDSTFLDGEYAAFGTVIDGMDIVDAISEDAHPVDDNGTIIPEEQPVIESITIEQIG